MFSASFNNSMISPACHSSNWFSNDFKWSFDFGFREGFCNRRLAITITALNAISFNGDSCIHSFISLEISSMKFLSACPYGKNSLKQIIMMFALFISQWWSWTITSLNIWIFWRLIVSIAFVSFIRCLKIVFLFFR